MSSTVTEQYRALVSEGEIERDAAQEALAARVETILRLRCYSCHGASGRAAKSIFVLDHSRLLSTQIVIPGDKRIRAIAFD